MRTISRQAIPGNRLVECQVCGFGYRFSEMRKGIVTGQKGLDVCPTCFDRPHPRDKPVKIRPKRKLMEVK